MRPGGDGDPARNGGEGSSSGGGGTISSSSNGATGATTAAAEAAMGNRTSTSRRSNNNSNSNSTGSSLDEVMRAPSTRVPDVVVIDEIPPELNRKEILDPKEDLWISTADGRYNSELIPLVVGSFPEVKTFTVHKRILEKTEFFRKALCGPFRESETKTIYLPEDDPAIFHHVIAFLYEGRYEPIKPIATELIPDPDKGKGREIMDEDDSDSDSGSSLPSDSTVRSRRRRERRRRREDRAYERMRQKHPGLHRPGCHCPQCLSMTGPPCWSCSAPRMPPPPGPPPPHIVAVARDRDRSRRRRDGRGALPGAPAGRVPATATTGLGRGSPTGLAGGSGRQLESQQPPPPWGTSDDRRIKGEDMRTWLLTYELNTDVYICANKFVMDDFKRAIARAYIDQLETAGTDAAQPLVLQMCRKLYEGVSESDPLLRMVLARVGFLQPMLMTSFPDETRDFLISNPEIAALVLRETTSRRVEDGGRLLPSMERHGFPHQHGSPWDAPGMIGGAANPFGPPAFGPRGPYHPHHPPMNPRARWF